MQPNNKLCNIVAKDGTNRSHNINEIYDVCSDQATNFLHAPRILLGDRGTSHVCEQLA